MPKQDPTPVFQCQVTTTVKLTIERSTLLKSLGHVQSVVERRNTIPILSNVRLQARDGVLALNATDMDLEVVKSIPASVERDGATTAPAHTLFEIVKKLPDGCQVEMSWDSERNQMTLRSGRSRFSLSCLPVEEFPTMEEGGYSHTFAVSSNDMQSLVDRTRFAISTEETRYYLNGIYLHTAVVDGTPALRAVATDGHRLAKAEIALPEGAADMPGVIVPRKTVSELRKLMEEGNADVSVSLSTSRIRFVLGSAVLTSKLIEGTYPDYEQVIPHNNDLHLEVDKKLFSDAVDRVSTVSGDKHRTIKVRIEDGSLTLSASNAEAGNAQEEVECIYSAQPLEIGFNSRYLLDIMSQIEGSAARLSMADTASPAIIRESADDTAVYVLMPVRV